MGPIPAILLEGGGENVIVPLKIDITHAGTRIVDSICWNLYSSRLSIEEFSIRTCSDLKLPLSFSYRMQKQLEEQIVAYRDIISLIKTHVHLIPAWQRRAEELQSITLGVRHKSLDYSDTILWDPMDASITPEAFARGVGEDLAINGIVRSDDEPQLQQQTPLHNKTSNKDIKSTSKPSSSATRASDSQSVSNAHLQTAIAYGIREALFRRLFHLVEEVGLGEDQEAAEVEAAREKERAIETGTKAPTTTVAPSSSTMLEYHTEEPSSLLTKRHWASFKLVQSQLVADMSLSLWKKAKPNSISDVAAVPVPLLPSDKNSNASVWRE
jgi:hypothetical protein